MGYFQSFALRKPAAMNNCVGRSSAEVFLRDEVPELGLLNQRANTFVILIDMAKQPPLEGDLYSHQQ